MDKQTPHKDRLVLVCLIAVLAFTIVNTVMLATNVAVAASVSML